MSNAEIQEKNTIPNKAEQGEMITNDHPPWPTSYYEDPHKRKGPLRHDIETYSPVDLTERGVYVYAAHPEFEILLCAFAYGDGPVEVLDMACGQPFPQWLEDDLKNPKVEKTAYNAMFERTCFSAHFRSYIPPTGWVCTMIQAASVSYPFSLEKCGEALGTDVQKDKRGKDLIRVFSMPHKRKVKLPDGTTVEETYRVYPKDKPAEWEAFKEYNRIDVETERSIANLLKEYPLEGHELDLYHLDQRINDRGILVDRVLVDEAIRCDQIYSEELREQAVKLMGISNPNSPLQFRAWLEAHGCFIDSMGKKQVAELMEKLESTDENGADDRQENDRLVREALRIRQRLSKSSVKKYIAADRFMCDDDRFRGGFQFYGANHTGRWSGRGLQLQNLAKNSMATLDIAREFLREGNLEALEVVYDNIPDVLSQLVRTMFIPKPGCRFVVVDFSAVEARALAWVSQEAWRLESFSRDEDIYCASASRMFGVPVVKHGVNGHLRQRGKIAELALGYGGGAGALEAMGALDKDYGLKKEELPELVKTWRESNSSITKFWWDVDKAATKAFETGREQWVANICFGCFDNKLQIKLPSGRILYYVNPGRIMNQFGQLNLAYDGVGTNKKWTRIPTYGPKLVENIIQGICRDILADAMLRVEAAGYDIVAHVHDEIICEIPLGQSSVDEIRVIMSQLPDWADSTLPLNADGYECDFYKKD